MTNTDDNTLLLILYSNRTDYIVISHLLDVRNLHILA